jgi:hypothetical protein
MKKFKEIKEASKKLSEEKATPADKAELALKHAEEKEELKKKHSSEKENLDQQEARDMGDYLGMDKKQKMKFDELMKKLKGGKEHMKFRRMAKTPVQGDDMFHGYVKDLATGAIKEATGVRQFGPIVLSKERKAKLVKVYDTLKVGDVVSIKFKRGGYQKQIPIRRKEVLRTGNRGWTRITFGDGVYLYKDPEEGRVVYAHGRMPSEVMDLIKESMSESVQINEVQQKEVVDFSDAQLSKMKKAYSTLKRIDPSSQNYKKLKTAIGKLDVNRLEQIARAKIRFVSVIAAGEYAKKSGKRLHARDYMESTELEESVKISFHSKGAKTKWMKKQAVASKEILNQTPTSVELPSRWKDFSKKKDHDEIFSVVSERKLTDAETDKREKVAKAIEKDNPDMPMGKKMAIATNVAKGVQMENDEYDNEGGMALQQLKVAKDAAMELCDIIKKDDNLPEWVQSKLTKAVDYMDSVRDYMSSKDTEEYVDEASAYADARRDMGGRGAQRGMAPLKKDVDNSATDADKKAANKNIIMQMRKAADLPNGADVLFPSGKKKVDRRTAQQVLLKFNSLKKSFEKEKFQKSIRSLSDVKKMIGR